MVIDKLIDVLRKHPAGLYDNDVRAAMGWPSHRQVGPYVTWARAKLRALGGAETIPYRRWGDPYRIVTVIDTAAWTAQDSQRRQARTRIQECAMQWEREGDRLTKKGKPKEAVVAYQNAANLQSAATLI